MRGAACAVALIGLGCASTVTRLDGSFPTPIGPAKSDCEKADWLVPAPTRVEFVDKVGRHSEPRDDGVALYRVGQARPESIPALAGAMGKESPTFERHSSAVRAYDTRAWTAAGLGVAGLAAIGIGTALFVSAFGTRNVVNADGTTSAQQHIDGTKAGVGGVLALSGFGLGIVGIAVNPGQAERSRAEAERYVFLPPDDKREDVVQWTQTYNQALRERCERAP
jgi:hypothetical protein